MEVALSLRFYTYIKDFCEGIVLPGRKERDCFLLTMEGKETSGLWKGKFLFFYSLFFFFFFNHRVATDKFEQVTFLLHFRLMELN
jgi:hypothetical protein